MEELEATVETNDSTRLRELYNSIENEAELAIGALLKT